MHSGAALTAAVGQAPPIPFVALAYRAIHLRHFPTLVAAQPLFAPAGGLIGSRYVAPGGPEALYVALNATTAYRELNGWFFELAATPLGVRQMRTGLLRPAPTVTLGIHVDVQHVLDLTNRAVRTGLGIQSLTEVLGVWRGVPNATTQVLGTEVFSSNRFQGILYPSARHRGQTCLVLYRQRLVAPARIDFRDAATGLSAQLP
jgi:RES domain-containing protein